MACRAPAPACSRASRVVTAVPLEHLVWSFEKVVTGLGLQIMACSASQNRLTAISDYSTRGLQREQVARVVPRLSVL